VTQSESDNCTCLIDPFAVFSRAYDLIWKLQSQTYINKLTSHSCMQQHIPDFMYKCSLFI